MFQQVNIKLTASKLIVAFISFPFLAATMLLITSDAGSTIITLALILFMFIFGYYASLMGLLKLPASIVEIIITPATINLKDSNGNVFHAEILQSSILLTSAGFLTFKCSETLASTSTKWNFLNKYKHVVLCRHNVENFDYYRNFRVIARFNAHA